MKLHCYSFRMHAEYVTTFKTESQRCSQWITFLEIRVEKISGEAEHLDGYQQLQEDHTVGILKYLGPIAETVT